MGYILAAILGGFLFFNSHVTPSKVEHMAQAGLQKRFPNAQVAVKVEGKRGSDVLHGKFKSVRVAIDKLGNLDELPIQPALNAKHQGHIGHFQLLLGHFIWSSLAVDAADFNLDDLKYDLDALKQDSRMMVVSSGPAAAQITVPASSLVALMRARLRDVENPKLTLQGNKVHISGKKPLPILDIPVPFSMTASLEARRGNEIWLTHPDVKLVDLSVGTALGNSILGNLNPIYVFDREKKWPFRVNINRIQTHSNKLDVTADLTFVPAQ